MPKKDLMIVIPYLGKLSLQIRTRINCVMKSKLSHCNFWIVFRSKCRLNNFFTFKGKVPIFWRSGIVYKFKCGGCNATYYGKTKRQVRMCEMTSFILQSFIWFWRFFHTSQQQQWLQSYVNGESLNQQRPPSFE